MLKQKSLLNSITGSFYCFVKVTWLGMEKPGGGIVSPGKYPLVLPSNSIVSCGEEKLFNNVKMASPSFWYCSSVNPAYNCSKFLGPGEKNELILGSVSVTFVTMVLVT